MEWPAILADFSIAALRTAGLLDGPAEGSYAARGGALRSPDGLAPCPFAATDQTTISSAKLTF